jgi:hypothetical protein
MARIGKGEGRQLTKKSTIDIEVQCYAGYREEETPRRFRFRSRKIEVKQVLDRWLDPDHRYFKLLGDDEGIYIIRHDMETRSWELTYFQEEPDRPRQA